jgi:hypothetical protein
VTHPSGAAQPLDGPDRKRTRVEEPGRGCNALVLMTHGQLSAARRPMARWLVAITIAVVCSCRGATAYIVQNAPTRPELAAVPAVRHAEANDSVVNARFRNVQFHFWPGVSLDLLDLSGRMHSTRSDGVVSFDDKRSFVLAIDTGSVSFPVGDLSRLMNTYVFAYKGAPLRDLSFTIENGHLVQRGVLHKVVDIPFEMVGEVSVAPTGEIKVHPVSMKICSIPGQGLMEALGVTLAKLLDLRQAKGVRVAGNDLFIDPTTLLPPPAISGRLVGVALEPGALVQYFGGATRVGAAGPIQPDTAASNYMLFRGGTIEFGKLFMVHADMLVMDLSPQDPFDFDIGRYHEQLVAGYHRTLDDDGLLVYMPDLAKMGQVAAASPR